jgi:hypothetical protein
MDRNLNNLLKWSIENSVPASAPAAATNGTTASTTTAVTTHPSDNNDSTPSSTDTPQTNGTTSPAVAGSTLNPEVLSALFGGPSEADLMRAAMEVLTDPTTTLDNKLIAFDNFEQLIESLDNANNLENLSLWTPLLSLLAHGEGEIRRMGGVPTLVGMAIKDGEEVAVRRKAIYALSSAVRNYQPAMDVAAEALAVHGRGDKVDAGDMDAVDGVIGWLREQVDAAAKA